MLFEILILRLRYKVSLRDVADIYLARGIQFSHTALADWETKFYPLLALSIEIKVEAECYDDDLALSAITYVHLSSNTQTL